jgi:subtilisin family serine protease
MKTHGKGPFVVLAACMVLQLWAAKTARGLPESPAEEGPLPPPPLVRGGSPHLDSRLARLADIERSQGLEAAARFAAANAILLDPDNRVRVLIHPPSPPSVQDEQAIVARVAAFGGEVRGQAGNLIEARLAMGALEGLPGPREIGWIEPAPLPVALRFTSQGVAVTQASRLLESGAAYRASAEPVRVGVLDEGFEGYQRLLNDELPASVTTRSFHSQGIEAGVAHGTACAEVVHDMAPEAELYLANFDSVAGHGQAVDWLVSQQVDVISYSIGWLNQGPGDGRGVINDHVRRALGAGVEWVVAAGNEAQTHWEGAFSDPNVNGWHNYASLDETNTVPLRAGDLLVVFLNWDDWFQSNQDYDLYIFDQSLRLMSWSTNFQTGTQPPTEVAGLIAPFTGSYHVAVYQYSATRNARLETFFIVVSPEGQLQYVVSAGSLTIPADTDGAIAAGATYWANDQGEPFSSRGPTSDGRTKPDLSAPDGVDTATYLAEGEPFYGTSAAAPHVAGAIALLKERFGIFSLDQVVQILYGRAIDRGPTGKDNQYGEGRLDLIGR